MSQMAVKCPHCQGHFTADTADMGKVLVCPSCQKQLRAPTEAPKLDSPQATPVIQINVNPPNRRKAGYVHRLAVRAGENWNKLKPETKVAVWVVAIPSLLVGTCTFCICLGIIDRMIPDILGLHSAYDRGWAGGNLWGELDRNAGDPPSSRRALELHQLDVQITGGNTGDPVVARDYRYRKSVVIPKPGTPEFGEYTRGFERGYSRGYGY